MLGFLGGLALGLLFQVLTMSLYRKTLALKADTNGGSPREFINGKPYVIITEKEYVEYLVYRVKMEQLSQRSDR